MSMLLIGERYRDSLEESLVSKGFELLWLPDNPHLDPRLAGHADLSAFAEGKRIVLSEHLGRENEIVKKITNRGYEVLKCCREQSCAYPNDVNLCACKVGDRLIHNFKYTDPQIIKNSSLEWINVNQGYAKCMVLVVDDDRIITADSGIAVKAVDAGITVLKIESGGVTLEGFDEGFIGGAGFRVGDTIYFTGDIRKHPDADAITDFILNAGLKLCCLTEMEPFDIGGAVVLE